MKNITNALLIAAGLTFLPINLGAQISKNTKQIIQVKENRLSEIQKYLEQKGFDIKNLIKSFESVKETEKFKPIKNTLYKQLSKNFKCINLKKSENLKKFKEEKCKNSKKIKTLEEYKKSRGFEKKKEWIPFFMEEFKKELEESEEKYNVPKEITGAIIGIESEFGTYVGKYNPVYTYLTMYESDYKKEFAKKQLEELLIFSKKNNLKPQDLKSSFAGAGGYGQFIPQSLNEFFIGDIYDMRDSIKSVANYLSKNKRENLANTIWEYNNSRLYVGTVIDLAKEAGFCERKDKESSNLCD